MFWENFLELCKKNNITPNGLAKKLSISSGAVTAWKNGRVPKWQTLSLLAEYFGISVEELISEQKETPPEEIPAGLDELSIKIINRLLELSDEQKIQALTYMEFLQRRTDSKNP